MGNDLLSRVLLELFRYFIGPGLVVFIGGLIKSYIASAWKAPKIINNDYDVYANAVKYDGIYALLIIILFLFF